MVVELVELIVGAVLIGGAAFVVYKEFSGERVVCPCAKPKYLGSYGTIPLPENVESWLYIKNPEPRGSKFIN